jgi:hypothetical protein
MVTHSLSLPITSRSKRSTPRAWHWRSCIGETSMIRRNVVNTVGKNADSPKQANSNGGKPRRAISQMLSSRKRSEGIQLEDAEENGGGSREIRLDDSAQANAVMDRT